MSSEQQDTRGGKHLTDIQEARRQAQDARRAVRREKTRKGSVSPRTLAELGAALADFQDLLHPYRDSDALDEQWDDRLPISNLEGLLNETVDQEVTANKATGRQVEIDHPQIINLNPAVLIEHGKELDEIFTDLGFAATSNESTHRTEIDDELMEEVKEWQQENLDA